MLFRSHGRDADEKREFRRGRTMFAASGYELMKAMKAHEGHEDWTALIVGFVVSTVVAFIAVKWLLGYIRTHKFTPFAIYRILLGAALLIFMPAA